MLEYGLRPALAVRVDAIAGGFLNPADSKAGAKIVITGNPVRPAVLEAARTAYQPSDIGQPFRLLVFGGSQGVGFMVAYGGQTFATDTLFVGVLIVAFSGILLTWCAERLERRFSRWRPERSPRPVPRGFGRRNRNRHWPGSLILIRPGASGWAPWKSPN